MKQKQKEKLVQLLSEMAEQAISLSVTEPNMKTEDFVKDWIANRNEDINAAFGTSRYSEQGLDEAAEKHLNYALFKLSYDDEDGIEQYILDAFEAGAEWQAEKDVRDMYMSDNRHYEKVYQLGKKDMKEQMMKDAVVANIRSSFGLTEMSVLDEFIHFPFNKNGDKVRIIIVKEEK